MQPYGPAVLRVAIGAIFVAHGAQKLFGVWGGSGLRSTADWFGQLGLTPAFPLAGLVGATELAGGVLLIAGALTVYASLALAVEMLVATWKVHLANGFFLNWSLTPGRGHGFEFNVALIGALVCLMLVGPGALSIDGRRARSAESKAAGRARLRAGHV
jgi:putative oxidoreductase